MLTSSPRATTDARGGCATSRSLSLCQSYGRALFRPFFRVNQSHHQPLTTRTRERGIVPRASGFSTPSSRGFGSGKTPSKGKSSSGCPCGSGKSYAECCGPIHTQKRAPESAEELMRARYSAYVKGLVDFIVETTHPDNPLAAGSAAPAGTTRDTLVADVRATCEKISWERLKVLDGHPGASDDEAYVTFQTWFKVKGQQGKRAQGWKTQSFIEKSKFRKDASGQWLYLDEIPQVDFVIKLGGAAITEKSSSEQLKSKDVLLSLIKSLAQSYHSGKRFIVVLGAGSFGHGPAKRYGLVGGGLKEGHQTENNMTYLARGIWETHNAVVRLQSLIIDIMIDAGLPAIGFSPLSGWTTFKDSAGSTAVECNVDVICSSLRSGFVPIVHGDVVLDAVQKVEILSGDVIVSKLAEWLRPKSVMYVSDVPGVLWAWPNGDVVRSIVVDRDGNIVGATDVRGDSFGDGTIQTAELDIDDVTGGMSAKLVEARQIASLGIPVRILGGERLGFTLGVIDEELPTDWIGTEISRV